MERLRLVTLLPGLQKQWVFGVVLGVLAFFSIKPWLAKASPALPGELLPPDREVLVTVNNEGNSSVILSEDSQQKTLPQLADIPNTDPTLGDRYVVWMGQTETGWHIFAYDLLSKVQLQVTHVSGANVHPVTAGEWIAWEHFNGSSWEAQFFDGVSVRALDLGLQPVRDLMISDHFIVLSQKLPDDTGWQPVWCDLRTGVCSQVGISDSASDVQLVGSELSWLNGSGRKVYFDIASKQFVTKAPVAGKPLDHEMIGLPAPEQEEENTASDAAALENEATSSGKVELIDPTNTDETSQSNAASGSGETIKAPVATQSSEANL